MTTEEYIKAYTKTCSNENVYGSHEPWLTPDHARNVAQIAREETVKEISNWIKINYEDIGLRWIRGDKANDLIENLMKSLKNNYI